jgi:hypothetical protein
MKKYRDLIVTMARNESNAFIESLTSSLPRGWRRSYEDEERVKSSMSDDRFCFRKDGWNAILFMGYSDRRDGLYVSNIVPSEHELSFDEYNALLEEFYCEVVKPKSEESGIETTLTSNTLRIDDILHEEVVKKLRAFSHGANKSTGNTHPNDFERWLDFVVTSYRLSSKLDYEMLYRWFVEEEGWYDDMADKLALQYYYSIELLNYYNPRS